VLTNQKLGFWVKKYVLGNAGPKTEKKRACSDERKAYRRLNKDVGRQRQ
jgi:hypothetical protein